MLSSKQRSVVTTNNVNQIFRSAYLKSVSVKTDNNTSAVLKTLVLLTALEILDAV